MANSSVKGICARLISVKVDVTGSKEGGCRVFFPRYVDAGVRVSERRAGANALLPILIQYSSQMRHVPR